MGPPGLRVPIAWINRLRRGSHGGSGGGGANKKTSSSSSEGSSTGKKKTSEGSVKKAAANGGGATGSNKLEMESLLGLLRVRIKRGLNLAVRDVRSSDPYVVVKMGKQKLRTHFLKKDVNPEWNEDLTLYVSDPNLPIKLTVYDHDTFSKDDKMGFAEIDIKPLLEALKMNVDGVGNESVLTTIQPGKSNTLVEESCVVLKDGKVTQDMRLRLKNVESGEVEIQIQWINLPANNP